MPAPGSRERVLAQLLNLKQRRKPGGGEGAAAARKEAAASQFRRAFDALPGYRQLKLQKAAAETLGLENPFFRDHDGVAGAVSSMAGREVVNFASYSYLGLNGHAEVIAAAKAALDQYGVSASASRLVAGERPIHRALEDALAALYGAEAAVAMVSGHATNVTVIGHLMGPKDLIVYDSYIHNSVVQGALLSGATRRSFPHNDWDALEQILAHGRGTHENVLILLEGLYSMDGDMPDLARAVALKERYGAWLMVDEAHALGTLGATGRGLAEQQGVDPGAVDIWMGTLSKTLCGCGGFIAGPLALVEYLKFTAPGFVYSVGMPPVVAAAALAALGVMRREPERVAALQARGRRFVTAAREAGLDIGTSAGFAIVPVITGHSIQATRLANALLARGVNALPIVYPAVAEKAARLRFFLTAEHTDAQVDAAVGLTAEALAEVRAKGSSITEMAMRLAIPAQPGE